MFSLRAGCHVLVLSSSAYSLFSTICYTIDSRLWKKIIGDKKKTIFTSLIKIINISNCRQEKGGTKIWSVWFLRWHEVTHATTSIIKIVYSNWRPQMKNIFMFSMVCYIWRMFIRIGEVLQSQWVYYFSIFGSIFRCCCFYQPFPKFCFGRSVYYM